MKMLSVAIFLVFSVPLWGDPLAEGKVVHTFTYTGVIFTASMAQKSRSEPLWIEHGKVTYWTPSSGLIDKAERAFSEAVREAHQKIPPGGFHFAEYYTPKYYSRDRERPLPSDVYSNEFYDWSPEESVQELRQYTGVTVAGKRALLISFFDKDDVTQFPWRSEWLEMCPDLPRIFYVPETKELSSYPF